MLEILVSHECFPKLLEGPRLERADRERAQHLELRLDTGGAEILEDYPDCLAEGVRRAELDDLRPREVDGRMARRHVVGIAGLVGLLAVREPEGHLSLDHIAPAWELAAVARQPAEEVREVGVGRVRLEADGVAAVEVLQLHLESLQRTRL